MRDIYDLASCLVSSILLPAASFAADALVPRDALSLFAVSETRHVNDRILMVILRLHTLVGFLLSASHGALGRLGDGAGSV